MLNPYEKWVIFNEWKTLLDFLHGDCTYSHQVKNAKPIGWDSFFHITLGSRTPPESCVHTM